MVEVAIADDVVRTAARADGSCTAIAAGLDTPTCRARAALRRQRVRRRSPILARRSPPSRAGLIGVLPLTAAARRTICNYRRRRGSLPAQDRWQWSERYTCQEQSIDN
jgi:hypothetical protein